MRQFYVADVSLEPHPTAPQAAKVLTVRLLAYKDHSEVRATCDLYGFESIADFKWGCGGGDPPNETKPLLNQVVADFVQKVGENNVISWQLPDLAERVTDFEAGWKKQAFGNALRAYGVTKRLTFEQALRVLEEHYVVEPVMES